MRLWHKDLIEVLPRQQLLAQWRECCCIAHNIAIDGTPNHILVNKVLKYPSTDFMSYCGNVVGEIQSRGYKVSVRSQDSLMMSMAHAAKYFNNGTDTDILVTHKPSDIFNDWHTDRYFWQCYFNLQEKYDCGGITEEEWGKIYRYAVHVKFGEIVKPKI